MRVQVKRRERDVAPAIAPAMHRLVIGNTGMGKTYLTKSIFHHIAADRPCLAYDPQAGGGRDSKGIRHARGYGLDGWPRRCLVMTDFSHFRRVFWESRGCAVALDECLDPTIRDAWKEITLMLTQGRHRGHSIFLLSQTLAYLNTTARRMCNEAFIFRNDDGENLAARFGDRRLIGLSRSLVPKEFLHVDQLGQIRRGRLA